MSYVMITIIDILIKIVKKLINFFFKFYVKVIVIFYHSSPIYIFNILLFNMIINNFIFIYKILF